MEPQKALFGVTHWGHRKTNYINRKGAYIRKFPDQTSPSYDDSRTMPYIDLIHGKGSADKMQNS